MISCGIHASVPFPLVILRHLLTGTPHVTYGLGPLPHLVPMFGCMRLFLFALQHLLTSQTTFPINHPVWISKMEERGVTEESDREAVAL